MYSFISNRIKSWEKVVSVEVVLTQDDGIMEIRSGLFSIRNSVFKEEEPVRFTTSLVEMVQHYGAKIPFVLTISGYGVLTKQISNFDENLDVVSQAIPSLNGSKYFFSTISMRDVVWVSFIARKRVDDILKLLAKYHIRVLNLFIGPLLLTPLSVGLLGIKNKRFTTPEYMIETHISDSFVFSSNPDEKSDAIIENTNYSSKVVLCMVGALSHLTGSCNPFIQGSTLISSSIQEEKYKNIFTRALNGGVIFIFCIVISNFFISNFLNDRYNDLSFHQTEVTELKSSISRVEKELDYEKSFLNKLGVKRRTKYSFFMDRLGKLVPKKISLTGLKINPVSEAKENKPFKTHAHIMVVEGTVDDNQTLSKWVQVLTMQPWALQVEVSRYMPIKRSSNHRFHLKIKI